MFDSKPIVMALIGSLLKCPTCSADKPKGEDTKGHRLNFSEEGAIVCQARQCTYWEIAGTKKAEVGE